MDDISSKTKFILSFMNLFYLSKFTARWEILAAIISETVSLICSVEFLVFSVAPTKLSHRWKKQPNKTKQNYAYFFVDMDLSCGWVSSCIDVIF